MATLNIDIGSFNVSGLSDELKNIGSLTSVLQKLSVQFTALGDTLDQMHSRLRSYQTTLDQTANSTRSLGNETGKLQVNSEAFSGLFKDATVVPLRDRPASQDNKALDGVAKLQNEVKKLSETPFTGTADNILKDREDRLKKIAELYKQIYETLKAEGLSTTGFSMIKALDRVYDNAKAKIEKLKQEGLHKLLKDAALKSASTAINTIGKNLVSSVQGAYKIEEKYAKLRENASADQIEALNKMMRLEKEINNGLSTLFVGLANGIASIGAAPITAAFSEGITKGDFSQLKNLFKGDNKEKGYAAATAFLGSAVTGLTPKTSYAGQMVGGALSGAGAGFMIGNLPGAIVGAIVGLFTGWFSASTANKQRQLEEQQLAEQKRTNALLERQNALAFTSSIIGQMTNQGIVTGVDRNAFGDVEFTIEGRKLKAIMDRENSYQERGL